DGEPPRVLDVPRDRAHHPPGGGHLGARRAQSLGLAHPRRRVARRRGHGPADERDLVRPARVSRIRLSLVSPTVTTRTRETEVRRRVRGAARVLVVVYGILALAATGRSAFQLITKFDEAPVAYSLSVVAGVVYILATIALAVGTRTWRRVAWIAVGFEM